MKTRTLSIALLALSPMPLLAGMNSAILVTPTIPAVGQAGLIALAFVVGLIGAQLIRKRRSGGS